MELTHLQISEILSNYTNCSKGFVERHKFIVR
ncbi:pyridoxamine 5'-phosphate oxidase [Prevotella brunnea]|uniref:Pyridoxamine 5'-phosphate oxidase n=1 Tax=Prevotella brunnea TaxID=2508867 RepID=A0A5C8G4P9_9BACT|nr:pyridoxamine 5'-phosphate oxidase [Prevotella brunnea]TXJ56874.1 pyridoxamine 5'-phosphate oxidase [Prevotella brunnea]